MRVLTEGTRFFGVWILRAFIIATVVFSMAACAQAPMAQRKHEPMKHGMKMEMATEGTFEGVGEVIAVMPEASKIVVGHEEIKGFMEAMPMGMGYAVESKALLRGLKPGDRVKFKIDAANKKIVGIEPL